jgi:hypothetical protein
MTIICSSVEVSRFLALTFQFPYRGLTGTLVSRPRQSNPASVETLRAA